MIEDHDAARFLRGLSYATPAALLAWTALAFALRWA